MTAPEVIVRPDGTERLDAARRPCRRHTADDARISNLGQRMGAGQRAWAALHDETVGGVDAERVPCDEIRSDCYAEAKSVAAAEGAFEGAGDVDGAKCRGAKDLGGRSRLC